MTRRNPIREGRNGHEEAPRFLLLVGVMDMLEWAMPYVVWIVGLWLIVWAFWCMLDEAWQLGHQGGWW